MEKAENRVSILEQLLNKHDTDIKFKELKEINIEVI